MGLASSSFVMATAWRQLYSSNTSPAITDSRAGSNYNPTMTRAFLVVALGVFAFSIASAGQEPLTWTAQQDHQQMMDQLGIKALRAGPNGRAAAGAPDAANY